MANYQLFITTYQLFQRFLPFYKFVRSLKIFSDFFLKLFFECDFNHIFHPFSFISFELLKFLEEFMIQNFTTKTVREIALEMPLTTKVFENYKIDYCCGGNRLFNEACQTAGVDIETVVAEISNCLENVENTEFDWLSNASLSALIEYIVDKHHVYTRNEIKNLKPLMAKVADRHGELHPELLELEAHFTDLCNELSPYMVKEEQILFPFIIKMDEFRRGKSVVPVSCFGTVKNPVRMMLLEHDTAGDILRQMRAVSGDYKIPENACPSLTALLTRLEAFEKDLHQHIHLENNLLFPRAIEFENEIFSIKG